MTGDGETTTASITDGKLEFTNWPLKNPVPGLVRYKYEATESSANSLIASLRVLSFACLSDGDLAKADKAIKPLGVSLPLILPLDKITAKESINVSS